MRFLGLLFVSFLLFACKTGSNEAELKAEIKSLEDSISVVSKKLAFGEKIDPKLDTTLLDLLKQFYLDFPESDYAPESLDKIHMKYAGLGNYSESAKYADTLIENYPKYVNRALVLESQATNYDFYIQPRDTTKVRYYYELLIKEFPDLPKEKREGIRDRLNHLDLTIEQMILLNN